MEDMVRGYKDVSKRDLHWGDTEEARDENEGAPGCLSEGDTGEVSPCRTCVGEPPSNQMGGGNSD